jgi:hypothetical protein
MTVGIGQVWKDNDKLMPERYIRIASIEGEHALCVPVKLNRIGLFEPTGKHPTTIILKQFKPTATGYALVTGGM